MSDQPPASRPLPKFEGDALARLLQLEAYRCGVDDWRTIGGKGVNDVPMLMSRLYNSEMLVKRQKESLAYLHKEVQKCTDMEGVVALVTLAILRAQANYDLDMRTVTGHGPHQ